MIIDAYLIFIWNLKAYNFAWLESNNIVILKIFFLYPQSYNILKTANLNSKRYLIFENLRINKISFNIRKLNYLWKFSSFKFKIFLE